ncbi:MAG: hypothetical protein ABR975_04910 [Vulcanimicrobiaceae bacterium]
MRAGRFAPVVALGLLVVVLISFVFIFAVPDRVEHALFLAFLRRGASHAQVATLAGRLGHRLVNATDGVASVEFALARTMCSERAERVLIFFDRQDRVARWSSLEEQISCS